MLLLESLRPHEQDHRAGERGDDAQKIGQRQEAEHDGLHSRAPKQAMTKNENSVKIRAPSEQKIRVTIMTIFSDARRRLQQLRRTAGVVDRVIGRKVR
jgi:hypothetical protein